MEGFKGSNQAFAPKEEKGPEANLVEANVELRGVVNDMGSIMPPKRRVSIFQRMFKGPEVVTEDPELLPFFDRVTSIEEKYGRAAVKEISGLYGAGRV